MRTKFFDLTGVVGVALLCVAAGAFAQQSAAHRTDDSQASAARKKTTNGAVFDTAVSASELPRRPTLPALKLPLAASSNVIKNNLPADAPEPASNNGRFSATGSAALIPVGRLGWHEISDWREVRRAGSSR